MGRVFVLGDLNVDVLCHVKKMPGREVEVHADSMDFSVGGNAANFAVVLGRLGVRPEFYSCVGDDFSSGFLRRVLESSGVRPVLREVPGSNGCTVAFVFSGGNRRFVSNKGASGLMKAQDLRPVLEGIRPGDIVYTGGLFHLPGLARGFAGFVRAARKKRATLMLDFSFDETGCSRDFEGFARHLDMVFMNESELRRFGRGDIKKSLGRVSGLGIRDVIVKLGSRGSLFYTNGMLDREPARRVKVVDTTGAGDVFNAAFVYGFMSGLLPKQCLRLGNWMAAWKVARTGISVPPRERISAFIGKLK
jgi:sugar/nucleoside kinase (ribokinase family)